jgi:hypothetical protein
VVDPVLLVSSVLVDPLGAEVAVVVAGENKVDIVLDKELCDRRGGG